MSWITFIISLLGSGVLAALVSGWMNHRTQIMAIKESGLYAKRAEVLDNIMEKMADLDMSMDNLVYLAQVDKITKTSKERIEDASDAFNDFKECYRKSRHYLPKKLSDRINRICDKYENVFMEFLYSNSSSNIKDLEEFQEKYKIDFTQGRDDIAEELRMIIGVK